MLINNLSDTPGTILGFHAQKLTELIAKALTSVHKQLILDPDSINNAQRKYDVEINKALSEWNTQWKDWADKDLATAYLQGVKNADDNIKRQKIETPSPDKPISSSTPMAGKSDSLLSDKVIPKAVQKTFKNSNIPNHLTFYSVFRRAAYHSLEGSSLQVLRTANDLFRDVAIKAGEKMFKETDIFTRRKFSQEMLDDLVSKGIQSVTYKNGRKVSIEAYAEMVGRTTSHHAAIQAELNRYEEYGYDLVRVSSHFRACPLCAPWEGAILKTNEINDPHQEEYDGYLSDAISAGLFHPNCAHSLTAYFPELSPDQEVRMDPAEQELVNQHGYKKAQELAYQAQEQQRYIERQIRNWKMRGITALDDAEAKKAYNKVLHWQTAMRTHIKDNSFLRRHYEVGKGYIREHVAGWDAFRVGMSSAGTRAALAIPEKVIAKVKEDIGYLYRGVGTTEQRDLVLQEMVKEVGFDKKPIVVNKEKLDNHINAGNKELFRGISGRNHIQYVEEFKTGEYFAGQGLYGNGIYTGYGDAGKEIAQSFAKGFSDSAQGSVMRMSLSKDAKIITNTDLSELRKAEFLELQKEVDALKSKSWEVYEKTKSSAEANKILGLAKEKEAEVEILHQLFHDDGRYALYKGFDAINVIDSECMILLNRGKVLVEGS